MSFEQWRSYRLSDIIEIVGGGTPRTSVPEYWNGDIPWISVVDFQGENKYIWKTEKHISRLGLENSSTKILKTGQVIISARGTVGELAILGRDMAFNQSCYGLNANNLTSNEFIYYLLKHNMSQIKQKTHGAVFDTITRETFDQINVKLPSLKDQQHIVDILSALDNKIELNRQTNATLEAIAQAIFKEWFVDFNYPGATSELVNGEFGLIPKGWRVGKLGDVCEFIKGVSYSSDELQPSNKALVTLKSINRGGGFNSNGFKEYSGKYKSLQCLVEGDLIFAQTDITQNADVIGSPAIVENPFEYDRLIASLDIVKCIPTNEMPSSQSLFYFLQSQEFKDYCLSLTNGSTVLHLRSSEVPNYSFVIPSPSILEKFDYLANTFTQKIVENNRQNLILSKLRDTLLPRFMRGEIEL